MTSKKSSISRRNFIAGGAALVTGATASACLPRAEGQWSDSCTSISDGPAFDLSVPYGNVHAGKVVEIFDASMTSGTPPVPDSTRASEAMKKLLLAVTGAVDLKAAWKVIFPGFKPDQKVGIKVNALNKDYKVVPHPLAVKALVDMLKSDGGFTDPTKQVIVWDRAVDELELTGLTSKALGCTVMGTEDEVGKQGKSPGYEQAKTSIGGWTTRLTTIQTRTIDYLINFAVMKNHGASGYTGVLKNHFGTINNPGCLHGKFTAAIPGVNVIPEVAKKSRLWLLDSMIGICKGDTQEAPDCIPNRMLASLDPLALDVRGREIRDAESNKLGVKPKDTTSQGWIDKARALGLGSDKPTVTNL